ncbi:RNA polymerase sigma factor [Streptomyces sp. NPDC048291]|uniref:RNA polymerase sigma factor n=1 Tax=Streptomyces sp. NPDC048291 TaxID=3365530 RepID=UPI003723BCA5
MNEQDPVDGTDHRAAASAAPISDRYPRQLLRQVKDTEFSAFYQSNLSALVGFLVMNGASVHTAADIAQEAMTDAYHCWDGIDHPKPWVYRAVSRALARRIASVENLVEQVPEPTSLVPQSDAVTEWETGHDILPVLRRLPPRQRQVLAWTLYGFTPTDIAEQLGLSADAVRANLKKARRAAAAHLETRAEDQ